jgi:hypothetical protein
VFDDAVGFTHIQRASCMISTPDPPPANVTRYGQRAEEGDESPCLDTVDALSRVDKTRETTRSPRALFMCLVKMQGHSVERVRG